MAQDKKQPAITLGKDDLKRPVRRMDMETAHVSSHTVLIPPMGMKPAREGDALISAPVDYKIFNNAQVWNSFAKTRREQLPSIDFSKDMAVILISLSDFSSAIFEITQVVKNSETITIKYRVTPLAASAQADPAQQRYPVAVMPKSTLPVRLEQTP
jgi:hypothetical protein